MSSYWNKAYKKKLIEPDCIEKKVQEIRSQGQTIATINGSFDLLHAGHLHMLFEASKQADCLLLALNSDASIKKYKSETRPLIPLEERLQMVASLSFIDYVTFFEETDPRILLEKIKPDVHVNGSEYGEECLESSVVKKNGGKIHIVKLLPGLSTTQIIEKIKCV